MTLRSTTAASVSAFLALQNNKIHCLNVRRRSFQYFYLVFRPKKVFVWLLFYRILSLQGINNFHNARGHYGEISPRQQPITALDFTGSNLRHIIINLNYARR